ncbi:transketolase [Saccharopolyspora rhizosphaerae]|uniref:Transketolase n=1 Tax=Saccharopolyspora rhizosphaerae TaxID=2492662 RepID=A0A426K372_9PSEU|nr:transketolase [Saccharopolyspora rhizosphaerae]RRO19915.1 transketolase [Saccharopolyspora rhizosphaerae]
MDQATFRSELAQQLRVDSVRASTAAGSGHPTSSMSAADLMAVLLDGHLRLDFDRPDNPANDHLIFSKGHASPLLYSAFKAVGAVEDDELLTFREFGSKLEGHPTPILPWVDVATGSLGQGLPIGVGLALAGKRLDRLPYRVWVLCGDSEMAEGSVWEALEHAGHQQLDNLIALIDVNRLGQTGPTMHGWDLSAYAARAQAAGWRTIEIDGHDLEQIESAYSDAEMSDGRPVAILARTEKGKGVSEVSDKLGFHGKPLAHAEEAIEELGGQRDLRVKTAKPEGDAVPHVFDTGSGGLPAFDEGTELATRKAYGQALAALGDRRGDVVALDGEVSNSTFSELFRDSHSDRYFEMYIAEQQMVAAAVGMQVRGWCAFASTFAAFLSRAYDFVRMAAISRADLRLMGSHAGVAIGEDGPSQMALEDLAAFRAVHGSTVLYPCDANQTVQLVAAMADLSGISYLRTSRGAMPVIYPPDEEFPVGGSKVVRNGSHVTLVGAGVTLHEALKAADQLASEGIEARVIDLYSIKPVDTETLRRAADETAGLVTAEDHWPEGGLGEAVLSALADRPAPVRKLAVQALPGSGKPAELLGQARIDAAAIAEKARELVSS